MCCLPACGRGGNERLVEVTPGAPCLTARGGTRPGLFGFRGGEMGPVVRDHRKMFNSCQECDVSTV